MFKQSRVLVGTAFISRPRRFHLFSAIPSSALLISFMEKKQLNPWTYQDKLRFGYSHGWVVKNATQTIYVSGQCSVNEEGSLMHEGDFAAQCRLVFDNILQVLRLAGATAQDVIQLRCYLKDMKRDSAEYVQILSSYFPPPAPAHTMVEVSCLAIDGMLLEVDAVAVL